MDPRDRTGSSTALSRGMMSMLLRRCPPPAEFGDNELTALNDLVQAMTQALSQGEMSIDLGADGKQPSELETDGWPETHRQVLEASGWLHRDPVLMVMDGDHLLWRRWHQGMETLEQTLIKRSALPPFGNPNGRRSESDIEAMASDQQLNPEQLAAVNAVSNHRVVLLSGGPGTGKTSTVRAMLIQAMADRGDLRIHLAAPTGKAARRLQDAIRCDQRTSELPCTTLHRLLQARPGGFSRHRRNPLALDLLVVDEASMVDLTLAQALMDALPANAQLLLVGDANQLPPIGVGAVWQHLQKADLQRRFGAAAVRLHQVYRNRGDLARLSSLLCQKGPEAFWADLADLDDEANVHQLLTESSGFPDAVTDAVNQQLEKLRLAANSLDVRADGSPDPEQANALLEHLDALIVLCPRRRGLWGVDSLHRHLVSGTDAGEWPEGLPVLCSDNQMELGLANGDLGLCIGSGETRRLLFRCSDDSGKGVYRLLHPARIRRIEPALALTVHKAQGSEADQVLLLWPPCEDASNTALLYTAITRARHQLTVMRLASLKSSGMLGAIDRQGSV
ncbi:MULTISPECIES: ATP-dependent RecD-like DNA helicase [unclassified Synechococcus]|uniref:ATP-dependent DNA helicase n=1 Tax=unclassified Synechococcus TaxID=2626047 RepID=UPI00082CB883|nr:MULTISPECIES: AAA family ATPase [unclassified Synechococcus]